MKWDDESQPTLLVVEDEKNTREGLRRALEERFEVYLASDAAAGLNVLSSEKVDLLLTDLRLGGEMDGLELLARAHALPKPPVCLLMTAYGSVDVAVQAMRQGAYDYVTKPLNLEKLELLLMRAWKERRTQDENVQMREELDKRFGMEEIIGESPAMIRVLEMVRQVAPSNATVLIEGESGTGKELVAKALHQLSGRKHNRLIVVHCAALSPQLLESELFGHERGAFTGATSKRIGRFEEANHGTLFLDEIGEVDPATQVKLLRALGARTIQRVGSNQEIAVDVRVVAATNKVLEEQVAEGKFREDLFFRLNEVPIQLPALRERKDDIPALAEAFIRETAEENQKKAKGLTADASAALQRYDWPGNVRELRTAMVYAVTLARGERIGLKDLPPRVLGGNARVPSGQGLGGGDLNLERMERRLIESALRQCQGNRTEAARKLGISRRTLHRKINEYQLS
ncbi:MAG: sigma-54 dependent transcriptional regulator [Verrucomicrobiota bacterium]